MYRAQPWRHAKTRIHPLKKDEGKVVEDKCQDGDAKNEKRGRKGGPIADDILALYNLRRMVSS